MTHMTLTDLLQNIQSKQTITAQHDLLAMVNSKLNSAKDDTPSFSSLFLMIYFALAISIANFLYLLVTSSIGIHFLQMFCDIYNWVVKMNTTYPTNPGNIEIHEINA